MIGAETGRVRERPRAVRAGHGAVAVGLVEVDEDALPALLLPPGRGDPVGHPPLQLAGRGDDGVPHVEELPSGTIGANTCRPRLPEVLMKAVEPGLLQHLPQLDGGGNASAKPVPGCGSRSMRSWSGLSESSARDGHGWNTTVFICAAQTAAAGSSMTSCGCDRALG